MAWAASPDGRIHAILAEINCGATTSFRYSIALHPAGHRGEAPVAVASLYGAVRNSCAYGVDLHWLDASTLALRFQQAEQVRLARTTFVGGRPVRIIAQPGHVNSTAPCGGMGRDPR